jgi:hypothetical protein
MLPNNLAVALIQAQHSFLAVDNPTRKGISRIVRAFSKLPISDIDTPLRNRRAGISRANCRSPQNRWTVRWEFFDNP